MLIRQKSNFATSPFKELIMKLEDLTEEWLQKNEKVTTIWFEKNGFPEFYSCFLGLTQAWYGFEPKNFYRQRSLNVALYDIIKSISVLEGGNASARFNRFG